MYKRQDWKAVVQPEFPLAPTGISQKILQACAGPEAYFKGLFVYGTNLPHTIPDINETLDAAADNLDLFVVIDTLPAEITGYADVVLPECTYLERYDDLRNSPERVPSLALRMPAFEPRHDTRPAWWMARQLAVRLELGEYFPWDDYTQVLDWQLKQVGSSLKEMQSIGVKRYPRKTPLYFADRQEIRFQTPSGKIELYSRTLAEHGYDPLPVYTAPEKPAENYYRLNYGRAPAHTFGRTTNNPLLFELMPENAVWVNPRVASQWQLKNGDYVQLKNQDGVISNKVRVRVTERTGANAVFMVHGFGHTAKGLRLTSGVGADDAGLMTNVKLDPIMGGTGMRANFVTFVRV